MNSKLKIFLAIWFYIGWFASVYSQVWNVPVLSLLFPMVALTTLKKFGPLTNKNLIFLLGVSILGFAFDMAAFYFNLISMPNPNNNTLHFIWLYSIWLLFVSVIPLMSSLFKDKFILAAVAGAILGPLSYYYGQFFNVLVLNNRASVIIYCLFWSLFLPTLIFLQRTRYEN